MATTNFYLDIKKGRKKHTIFMYYRYSGTLLKYHTQFAIETKLWNTKKKRARKENSDRYKRINKSLDLLGRIADEMRETYFITHQKEPSKQELKQLINEKLKRTNSKETSDMFLFIEEYIKDAEGKKGDSSIRNYKSALKHLREYAKEKSISLNFKDINMGFYDNFTSYLIHTKELKDNSIGGYIKNIKTFLNSATQKGINKNLAFKQFKVHKKESESAVYLTIDELDKLYKLDLSDNKRLDDIRNLFLIGCYTGLRFGDLSSLVDSNIIKHNSKKFIQTTIRKTKNQVTIPFHPVVEEILAKYDGKFPTSISNQKTNKNLKELCKKAGFTEMVEKITSIKAKTEVIKVPKYQLITTHTARRSFATNAYLAGIPAYQIMLITEHKRESTFLKYIKITKKENAVKLDNHRFFNEKGEAAK